MEGTNEDNGKVVILMHVSRSLSEESCAYVVAPGAVLAH